VCEGVTLHSRQFPLSLVPFRARHSPQVGVGWVLVVVRAGLAPSFSFTLTLPLCGVSFLLGLRLVLEIAARPPFFLNTSGTHLVDRVDNSVSVWRSNP
jgi:hypothetical protein